MAEQLAALQEPASIVVVEDDHSTPVIPIDDPPFGEVTLSKPRGPKTELDLVSVEVLAVPSAEVLDESIVAPPDAFLLTAVSPLPEVATVEHHTKPKPPRRRRTDTAHRLSPPPSLRRRRWSAEEFDGELQDQVNDELAQSGWWQTVDSNGVVSIGRSGGDG